MQKESVSMTKLLADKVAIVTGAGSGLGEATSKALAGAGASILAIDIDEARACRVADEINGAKGHALALAIDVSDWEQVRAAVDQARSDLGRVDILVNAAAIDHTVAVHDMSVAQWDAVLNVNLRGPFLFCKAVLPLMRQQGGGHIVNVASTAAKRAWSEAAAYHASKWGLIGFTRGLGVEGRRDNVRATAIVPGGMRTHFFDRFAGTGIPMPAEDKLQDPQHVAELIAFIVSRPEGTVIRRRS
jgi:NAD(P)-dependent dehydrogenase (short-subunit alcohol dehydrogenase family)